ncbi:DUF4467 domain-containing protein [Mammaliicoccus sciuri]|uniref:DUF4467 domain-containing protein n=1 Tax=Mammaliicoccus sciuri TaxID=1296 RepID=UPI0021D1EE25|nr:DUF4467 domain-containing protein [Mammaliicoccus sciuri]UXV29658.1 DUF4467 domain-containing protein [Mammaliicoccus sciuri]
MKKWCVLLLSIVLLLAACGQNYDKEIDEVAKLEKKAVESSGISDYRDFKKDTSNFYVYEDGKIITVTYKTFKNSDTKFTNLYRLNETSGKYEEDKSIHVKKYMKNHESDYKEENLKK